MTLPQLAVPEFFTTLPICKKKIKYRPFLVKEEKVLLIAIKEETEDALFNAVKQIAKNCTFNEVDIETLSNIDLEYLFLQIRIKSKSNMVDIVYQCTNKIKNEEGDLIQCDTVGTISYNLDEIQLVTNENHSDKIMLTDVVGIKMKYGSLENAKKLYKAVEEENIEEIYANMKDYIDCIFDDEKTYDDFTTEEWIEFFDGMTSENHAKIKEFFNTQPVLQGKIKTKCPTCKNEDELIIQGLQNFLE